MHPIIVLEGPDGAGKTHLGQYLAERMGGHYEHATYRFKDRMFTYHWAVLERAIKRAKTQPVILDRWWPSEFIYADVFRGGSPWPMARRLLDRAGLPQGVIYVVCLPSNRDEYLKQFEERKAAGGEMYDTVDEVAGAYDRWYYKVRHRHDFMQYDRFTHGLDLPGYADEIRHRYFQIQSRIPAWFQNDRTFAGQFIGPKTMIIGERSNPKGRHTVWPFFEHANSSLWLTQTLELAGIQEENVVWANAFNEDGWMQTGQFAKLQAETNAYQILALGGKAQHAAMIAGLANKPGFHRLDHPAYVKRFQGGDPAAYLEVLKGSLR